MRGKEERIKGQLSFLRWLQEHSELALCPELRGVEGAEPYQKGVDDEIAEQIQRLEAELTTETERTAKGE